MARILGEAMNEIIGLERRNFCSLVTQEALQIAGSEVVVAEGIKQTEGRVGRELGIIG